MFEHVLVATDGSELSETAAFSAVQLAKSLSARLTAVTSSTPFHVVAIDAVMLTETEEVYMNNCKQQAEKYLRVIETAAKSSGLSFEGIHVFHAHPYAAIIGNREHQRLRPYLHGFARAPRGDRAGIGQRDDEGTHPLQDSSVGVALGVSLNETDHKHQVSSRGVKVGLT